MVNDVPLCSQDPSSLEPYSLEPYMPLRRGRMSLERMEDSRPDKIIKAPPLFFHISPPLLGALSPSVPPWLRAPRASWRSRADYLRRNLADGTSAAPTRAGTLTRDCPTKPRDAQAGIYRSANVSGKHETSTPRKVHHGLP